MKYAEDIIVAVIAIVVLLLTGWFVLSDDNSENHHNRFEGACAVRGGTVESDLCVKDNQVILRLDDVK